MKKIGIMGAMQVEIELILKEMEITQEYKFAGFPFFTGVLRGKEVVLTRCGVGKVNAAACTQLLIDKFSVDYIINTGIAGSLREDVGICDLVLSTDVTHHDVRKAQMKNLYPFQESFIASEELITLATTVCEKKGINYHSGRIVSGECFVDDSELKKNLINEYSPACVEMEGSAIGHVAYMNEVHFIVLRCISDLADDEAGMTYEKFEEIAGEKSALVVVGMVELV
ncbi:5'-methylthioadenosine/adenosylhomocysteine nucleosidase [Bacillus sp. AK128]